MSSPDGPLMNTVYSFKLEWYKFRFTALLDGICATSAK